MEESDLKKHNNVIGMAYACLCAEHFGLAMPNMSTMPHLTMGLTLEDGVSLMLHHNQPYWLDDVTDGYVENRFRVSYHTDKLDTLIVHDKVWDAQVELPMAFIQDKTFDLPNWYNDQILTITQKWVLGNEEYGLYDEDGEQPREHLLCNPALIAHQTMPEPPNLELNRVQVPRGTYPAVQRNVAAVKASCVVPRPIVIMVKLITTLQELC
jgi:hypothetical protein